MSLRKTYKLVNLIFLSNAFVSSAKQNTGIVRRKATEMILETREDPLCPCLNVSELLERNEIQDVSNYLNSSNSTDTYGIGCSAHDISTTDCIESSCDVSILSRKDCEKAWCKKSWCYIDAENCQLYNSPSVLYENRFYSYATCGFYDSFTNPYNIAPLNGLTFRVGRNANTGGWKGSYNPGGSFAMNDQWGGPLLSFFEEAAVKANVTFDYASPPEKLRKQSELYFGSTSSFDYCVYTVALGYLDFCIAGFTINSKRTRTTPFFEAYTNKIYIIAFTDDEAATWDTFVNNVGKMFLPFTLGTWMTILFILFLLGFIMFLLEFKSPNSAYQSEMPVLIGKDRHGQLKFKIRKLKAETHIANSMYRSTLALCHQSYEQSVVTTEGKINLFGISSFILIITAIYTANLAAMLTSDIQKKSISSIDEAIHQGYNFCAERNLGLHIAELYNFDLNFLVPDPVELGGDGKPGFACPNCAARERTLEQMRRSHSDKSRYCNAAFAYDEDLEYFHNLGMHCDKDSIAVLGKVQVGIPISRDAFGGITSLFHELKYKGVMEKSLVNNYPKNYCTVKEGNATSLSIIQLSGVWIFCSSFTLLALIVKWIRPKFTDDRDKKKIFYTYDQWGNPTTHEDIDGHLAFQKNATSSNREFLERVDSVIDIFKYKGINNAHDSYDDE